MNQLTQLCEMIQLQDEMTEKVLRLYQEIDFDAASEAMALLFSRDTWDAGRAALKSILGEDKDGCRMLTCMLICALKTRDMYRAAGIPEDIFTATFRCFPRFISEHKASYGSFGFDRDFWTPRQLGMQLFRIGELEYELMSAPASKTVSLHIPSDAHIQLENIKASCVSARSFLQKFFPDYQAVPFVCESWLLSPALKQVLSPDSKICRFQALFSLEQVDENADDVLEWVFGRNDLALQDLPENTTLQRNLKKYMLAGGKVGIGYGTLLESRLP